MANLKYNENEIEEREGQRGRERVREIKRESAHSIERLVYVCQRSDKSVQHCSDKAKISISLEAIFIAAML